MLQLSRHITLDEAVAKSPNLCSRFTQADLDRIGGLVFDGYTKDKASRSKWERRMSAAMDLAMQVQKDKNFPWQGAANVVFPLITIAALQFSARSYPNLIQGTDVVRYRVVAQDPSGEVMKRADRIARHMSWQVLEEDESWEEQHDRLLINLAIVGSAFIKSYFSGTVGHNVSELVMSKDLVIDYWAKSIEGAARATHVIPMYRNEIYEKILNGVYCDVRKEAWYQGVPVPMDIGMPQTDLRLGITPVQADEDSAFIALEQHRNLDLDGDGYEEPYIVTIEQSSKKVLRLVARWETDNDVERTSLGEVIKINATHYFTKYSFIPSPDGGIYDLGFGAFLGPINEAVSTAINQLLDSGTMQNSIGGFLGRGAKIRGGVYSMAPWEFKRVDSSGDDLRKNLVPFPEKQPLAVTFQLIGLLIEYADRLSGTTDTMVGVNPGQNTPAETSRTMTEQGEKVYSAVFKRVWRSMKCEFGRLYILNRQFLRSHQTFSTGRDFIRREDYLGNPDLIAPVANPNITSTTMRMAQAVMVKQAAMTTPGYDREEAERRFLKSAQVENIDTLYVGEEKAKPLPNPKLMVEQAKLQGMQMKIEAEKMHWANELLQDRPLVQAQVDKLKAEAAQVIAEVGEAKAARVIAVFELMIKGFEAKQKADSDRMKNLISSMGEKEDGSKTGGIPQLAGTPGDKGVQGDAAQPPPQPNGAMGGGGLPMQ